jgi:hypothetical protein
VAVPKKELVGKIIVGEFGKILTVTLADAVGFLDEMRKVLFPGLAGVPLRIPSLEKVKPEGGGVVELFPHVVELFPPVTEN